jgi:hypothetical protein
MLNKIQRSPNEVPIVNLDAKIIEALKGLKFGSVEIVIHDGRVVQIERREKWRMNLENPAKSMQSR